MIDIILTWLRYKQYMHHFYDDHVEIAELNIILKNKHKTQDYIIPGPEDPYYSVWILIDY